MNKNKPIEAFPLTWPEGRDRTQPHFRERNYAFWRGTLDKHRRSLQEEIRMLGGRTLVVSTNVPLRKDGEMMSTAREPEDPGVAVYFQRRHKATNEWQSLCFACDKYGTVRENIRAIAVTIESIRRIERHGSSDMMERAFKGFTALPERASEFWREVLDIPPDAKPTPEQIEKSFRCFAHIYHPDKGGTHEEWLRLVNARENAMRDLGVTR